MPKFLMLFRRAPENTPTKPPSPEAMQQMMATWNAWLDKFKKSGNLLDPGDALKPTGKVVKSGGVVTDGPIAESKEVIGGFSIIQADTYDEAVAIALESPGGQAPGALIEVREFAGWV